MEFSLYPPENVTGASDQPFEVGDPTSQSHAVPADWVGYYPSLPSAATVDIFGASGATISIDNSTPVTTTDFTDCTAAQVGSIKRVIPAQDWTITASANMIVNGASSGDFDIPAGSRLDVVPTTTSTFNVYIIYKSGLKLIGTIGTAATARTDAQLELSNEGGTGHTLLAMHNSDETDEVGIYAGSVLDDASITQQSGTFTRFVNSINTAADFDSVWGVHLVGAGSGSADTTNILAYSNNSVWLSSGLTGELPWDTLPPANSLQFGKGATTGAGVQFVQGISSGYCGIGPQNLTLSTANASLLVKSDGTLTQLGAATGGVLQFAINNATIAAISASGMLVGAPTGSYQGAGTINVSAGIYLNGGAYTNPDYVFERWATGKIDKYASKSGAATYKPMTLQEMESFVRKNFHFPGLGQKSGVDLFAGSDVILARLEEAYIHLFNQEKRIQILEEQIKKFNRG